MYSTHRKSTTQPLAPVSEWIFGITIKHWLLITPELKEKTSCAVISTRTLDFFFTLVKNATVSALSIPYITVVLNDPYMLFFKKNLWLTPTTNSQILLFLSKCL